jgi:hypothetical protein
MRHMICDRRRGLSLIEVQVAAVAGLLILGSLLGFTRFNSLVWYTAMAGTSADQSAQGTVLRLAPSIRAARSVVTAGSTSKRLTLQLPAYDATGTLIVPLQDGQVISYYLSDTTGAREVEGGTILWRSVDGVPDRIWSMRGSEGRVVPGAGGLRFSYYPSVADAETVTLTVTGTATAGTRTSQMMTSQEILLRNRGL